MALMALGFSVFSCIFLSNIQINLALTSVRLVNGPSSNEGRVEVYIRGQWLALCADQWDLNDADVVCYQLGYYYAIVANEDQYGSATIWSYDLDCTGYETTVYGCSTSYRYSCHEGNAGVVCSTSPLYAGALSLAKADGYSYQYGGRLEYYYNRSWGTVCSDGWDSHAAEVACRQMGFNYVANDYFNPTSGSSSQRIWVDDVSCSGSEPKLYYCRGDFFGDHNCDHSEDVGIVCSRSYVDRQAPSINTSVSVTGIVVGVILGTFCLILLSAGVVVAKKSVQSRTTITAPLIPVSTTIPTTEETSPFIDPDYTAPPKYDSQPAPYPVQPPTQPSDQDLTNQLPQGEYPTEVPPPQVQPQYGFTPHPPPQEFGQAPPPGGYPATPLIQFTGANDMPPPYYSSGI